MATMTIVIGDRNTGGGCDRGEGCTDDSEIVMSIFVIQQNQFRPFTTTISTNPISN